MNIDSIFVTFVGTLLALASAAFVWLIRRAYEKHKKELIALAKLERMYAFNLSLLKDTFEFIERWKNAIDQNRPYNFYFDEFLINDESTFNLSNLGLVNKVLSMNYMLKRSSHDIKNIYKSYWEIIFKIDTIEDPQIKLMNLTQYHKTVKDALVSIQPNEEILKKEMIDIISTIRVIASVRNHSLFGYVDFLFKDIFPRVTKEAIKKQKEILEKNIAEMNVI